MTLPFWPKIAAASDAPNYQPTAGDDRCGVCAYFRALNDGSGYCEKFSFQCEPQSVCDDFVAAGNVKTSSASTVDRLRELLSNPVVQRAGISGGAGAVSGAGFGARDTGKDKASQGAKGALIGGALGTALGLVGPASRSMAAEHAYDKGIRELGKSLKDAVARKKLLQEKFSAVLKARRTGIGNEVQAAVGEYKKVLDAGMKPKALQEEINRVESVLKNSKYEPDMKAISTPDSAKERYGAPALSALLGGAVAHGSSLDSREQNRFRKSKSK